jgi:hypothetical protein
VRLRCVSDAYVVFVLCPAVRPAISRQLGN